MASLPNPFLLAADNSPELVPLLRQNPGLASSQDDHGYSLVHAAASYNHLDLLRALIREFKVDVNLRDEDDETALFVVETVDAARVLVEELNVDIDHRGGDKLTAREKIEAEGDFPAVVAYLTKAESEQPDNATPASKAPHEAISPPPEGMSLNIGTMSETHDLPAEADPEFRRRIEELAQRDDFDSPEGQAELRRLVEDAILGQGVGADRSVRPRQD